MNRSLTFLIGPETVLTLVTLAVFWFCVRHNSGEGRDVQLLEKLVMWLPFAVVPLVFATILTPGAKSWLWLSRAILLTFIALGVCAGRIVSGFGSGAKGQDAGFIMVMVFALIFVSIAAAITGAMILAETRPAFAEWFRMRRIIGSILTLLAAVPIGFALGMALAVTLGVVGGIWSAFSR